MVDGQLLRRAWDALDSFKQAYPENWHEEDEQVLKDLMRADLKLSGIKLKWQGLTDEEIAQGNKESWVTEQAWQSAVWWAEAKLKEKNT